MRRVAGLLGLTFVVTSTSGCFLYFGDDDDDDRPVPIRDAGPMTPDANLVDTNPPPCEYPQHSTDCSEVTNFQCGFEAQCDNDTLVASWHEHVFCEGYEEQIVEYTCSYQCADGCTAGRDGWLDGGEALVLGWCVAGGTGSSCDGQCGLAVDGCYCDEACGGFDDCCADYDAFCAACEGLDEDACQANAACMPVYTGINCTDPEGNTCTDGDSNCTCQSFEFHSCVEQT